MNEFNEMDDGQVYYGWHFGLNGCPLMALKGDQTSKNEVQFMLVSESNDC